MKRKIYVNRPKKIDEWYDEECRAARKTLGSYYVNFVNFVNH